MEIQDRTGMKKDALANSLRCDGKAKKLQMQGLRKPRNEAYILVRRSDKA